MLDIKKFIDELYESYDDSLLSYSEIGHEPDFRNKVKKYLKENGLDINWVYTATFMSNGRPWEVKSKMCENLNEDIPSYYNGFGSNFRLLSVYIHKIKTVYGDPDISYHIRFAIDDNRLLNDFDNLLEKGRRMTKNMEQW